jgi:DegV family protein with EDD domain
MTTALKQTVRVVCDSTADMSADQLRALGVEMIPLRVIAGTESFRDGLDITPAEFYKRLPQWNPLPTTSQPPPGEFIEVYKTLIDEGYDIISIHLSSKLSGTYQNASTAALNYPGKVRLFDTMNVSAATAMYVRAAAEMARFGKNIDEIERELHDMYSRVKMAATLNTLEYLQKGGRIGKAKALIGSLLSVKPIITLKEGEVHTLEQVRTRSKAVARLAEMVKSWGPLERIAIMHAEDPDAAGELSNMLSDHLKGVDRYISDVGPVIGTHTGPGTLGVCAVQRK